MILTALSILIILLLTAYLASQGLFSAVMQLTAALFASLLALGLYEVLAPYIASWRPDYSYGVLFLGLFFLAFSALRLLADIIVPRNIVLPIWIDRIAGGAIGFLASLIIVGTTLIGIEMLPVAENMLALSTPPSSNTAPARTFPAPFVTGLYYFASGRALEGTPLASIHPDLGLELTGYRHTAAPGARISLTPERLAVKAVFEPDSELLTSLNLTPAPNHKIVVVRSALTRGADQPAVSFDVTNHGEEVLLTPTQIRLVTKLDGLDEFRQAYPLGDLRGNQFEALPTYTSFLTEDYNEKSKEVFHDWVFEIDSNAKPVLLEIKQGGRVRIDPTRKPDAFRPLTLAQMAPRAYLKELASLQINTLDTAGPLADAEVFIVADTVLKKNLGNIIQSTYDILLRKSSDCQLSRNGWSPSLPAAPGLPPNMPDQFEAYARRLQPLCNRPNEELINWSDIITPALYSSLTPNGRGNLTAAKDEMKERIIPHLKSVSPSFSGKTNAAGHLEQPYPVSAGKYCLIIILNTPTHYAVSFQTPNVAAKEQKTITIDFSKGAEFNLQLPN